MNNNNIENHNIYNNHKHLNNLKQKEVINNHIIHIIQIKHLHNLNQVKNIYFNNLDK